MALPNSAPTAPLSTSDPTTDYALAVIAGAILAGPWVRASCRRHLADIDTGAQRGLRWSIPHAAHALSFQRFVHHSKGEWRGKILALDPWEQFCVGSIFGWLKATPEGSWLRRFRTAYHEIPKKNGKSTLCAFVGLYLLVGDGEPGAEIYAAASARKQALLVFNDAKEMVRTSPELRQAITILMSNLSHAESYSKFEPISADENTGDGDNPSAVIIDELHRIKTRGLRTALTQGFGARRQPIELVITTAGDDRRGTPYDEEHSYAEKILDGVLTDDSYFAYIACPDPEDPWDDPLTWAKANPGFGLSVKLEDLKARALKARSSPAELADFKRFRLNIRTSDIAAAIRADTWRKNTQGPIDETLHAGRLCHAALDLAAKIDIAAEVLLFPPDERFPRWLILPRFWMPREGIQDRADRDRVPYGRWAEQGLIRTTEGNRIDYHAILAQLKEDAETFTIHDVAFDPWNAGTLEADAQSEGFAVVEFGQTMANYSSPTKELLAMVLDGLFEHGGNEVLAWMASNLVVIKDTKDNQMPSKKHSTGRIDGMSATIMALGRALAADDTVSVYATRDMIFL